jgi:hypothetical protein
MMPEDKPEIHNGILNMTPEEILANNSDDNIYRVLFSADPFDTSYNYTRDLPLFNKSTDTEVFQPSIIDDPLLQRWIDSIKKLPKLKPNQVVILDSYTPEFLKMRSRRYGEMTAFKSALNQPHQDVAAINLMDDISLNEQKLIRDWHHALRQDMDERSKISQKKAKKKTNYQC